MITYFLALFLSLFSGQIHTPANGTGTPPTTMNDDGGGETGHVPNQPPPPTKPPVPVP